MEEASLEEAALNLQALYANLILKILVIKFAKRLQHQHIMIVRQARQSPRQKKVKTQLLFKTKVSSVLVPHSNNQNFNLTSTLEELVLECKKS